MFIDFKKMFKNFELEICNNKNIIFKHNTGIKISVNKENNEFNYSIQNIRDVLYKFKDILPKKDIMISNYLILKLPTNVDKRYNFITNDPKLLLIKNYSILNYNYEINLNIDEIETKNKFEVENYYFRDLIFNEFGVIVNNNLFNEFQNIYSNQKQILKETFIDFDNKFILDINLKKDYDRKYKIMNNENNLYIEL